MNQWGVIAIGLLLIIASALAGILSGKTVLGVGIFILLGMLMPVIAVPLGAAMLLVILLVNSKTVTGKIQSKVSGSNT